VGDDFNVSEALNVHTDINGYFDGDTCWGWNKHRSARDGQLSESKSMACGKRYVRNVGGPCTSTEKTVVCEETKPNRNRWVLSQGSQTSS